MLTTVPCPKCGIKADLNPSNINRPFCSARCRNEDFIEWGNEEKRIAGDDDTNDVMSEDLSRDY